MSDSIPLHPKYGLNPSLDLCPICGAETGVALLGNACKEEAPRQGIYSNQPCDKCGNAMKQGVMFIEVRDGEEGKPNPYRTGRIAAIKDEAVKNIVNDKDLLESILKSRQAFVPKSVFRHLIPDEVFEKGDE